MAVTVDLTGRRVLVTGASSGIGEATCRSIVSCGGSVAMLARRAERLEALEADLGPAAIGVPCDLTDLAALEAAVEESASRLGGLDGIIAVAGQAMIGAIASGTPSKWMDLLRINLVAPLAAVRFGLPHFPASGRRDVVLVGSAGGITPLPGVGIYAASKRGLKAAFDTLRLELAHQDINVGFVAPGDFATDIVVPGFAIADGDIPPGLRDVPRMVPGAKLAAPDALADTIAFMISLPEGTVLNEVVARSTGALTP